MGHYATKDDIVELYGLDLLVRVADHDKNDEPDDQVVDMGLTSADDLINAHLQALYDVPFDPVPGVLKKLAIDIAVYTMAHGRAQRTDEMRLRYEDAIKMLEKMAAGKIGVGGPGGGGSGGGSDPGGPGSVRKGRTLNAGRA